MKEKIIYVLMIGLFLLSSTVLSAQVVSTQNVASSANACDFVDDCYFEPEWNVDIKVDTLALSDSAAVCDNRSWFITLGVGAQAYFGESDRFSSFGHRVTPTVEATVGAWLAKAFAVRVGYSGYELNGYIESQNKNETAYGEVFDGNRSDKKLYKQKWNYHHLRADFMLDVTGFGEKCRQERFYSLIPYLGVGYAMTPTTKGNNSLSGSLGVSNYFRLSKGWCLNLDLRGSIIDDRFDSEVSTTTQNYLAEGILSLTAGVVYQF